MPSVIDHRKPAGTSRPMATRRGALPEQPSLAQFVILSMLLHALFISLFGAPGGGSPGGRAMWGSLEVVLRGPFPESAPGIGLDRAKAAEPPAIAVRKRTASPRETTPEPARPAPAPATPLPPLDLSAPKEVDRPVAPEAREAKPPPEPVPPPEPRPEPAPAPVPFSPPPLLDRITAPEFKSEMLPPVTLPPVPAPFVPPPLLERITPPELKTEMLPAVKLPPVEMPVIPAPMPEPGAPSRQDLRMLPPVELPPVPAPAVPAPVVEPVPPAVIERLPTPPVERAPVEVPAVPAAPVERAEPSRVERPTAPPEKATPREVPAAPPPAPAIERAQPRVPDRDSPSRPEPAPRSPAAAPADRDSDIFRKGPAAPPAAADKGAAPRIDLEAARKRAREIAREGSGQRAILPFPMPPQEERKSKEALALEKALKPDCRKAYQGLGLLAVVPLIANEFGEGSCRW